jgi:hypothetical protein
VKPVLRTESPVVTQDDIAKWEKGELKARTRLELAISDTEMAHIIGAETAYQIWERLCQVKEPKGRLGILAARRQLYRSQAREGFDMVEHVNNLRALQAELALMSNVVSDEDFVMILIASLPESWDVFATSYLGSHSGDGTSLNAKEFIPLLLEEDRRRRSKSDGSDSSLQAKFGKGAKSDMECFNCKKKGHLKRDCWRKGGGKEGQGPKGRKGKERSNQATDGNSLNDAMAVAYMARFSETSEASRLTWYLDSSSTSHIATMREAFTDYTPLNNATVKGVGPDLAIVNGIGSVMVNFAVGDKTITHTLKDVLHVPKVPNCLLSLSCYDDGGGVVHFKDGQCVLKNKAGMTVGQGSKSDQLYKLDA